MTDNKKDEGWQKKMNLKDEKKAYHCHLELAFFASLIN